MKNDKVHFQTNFGNDTCDHRCDDSDLYAALFCKGRAGTDDIGK